MGEEQVFDPHASELAQLKRSAGTSPAPGSLAEAEALAAIDDARIDEENALSAAPGSSRRRRMRHWSDRQAQLDGR